jgi:large conductance mechanosensitive channel
MFKEFKAFALKGNLVDLAIGVVMGTAFGKVVTAFIDGMVMPVIGKIMGNVDFNNLYIPLNEAVVTAKAATPNLTLEDAQKVGPVIAYGSFITVGIDFLIVAMVVFMVIKALSRMKKAEEAAPVAPPASEVLLTEIRDLLKK